MPKKEAMNREKPIKVLFPTGSFYPAQTGGPDNSVYWITKALKRKGMEVKIVTTERGLPEAIPRQKWLDKDFGRIIYTKNWIHYFPLQLIRRAFQELKGVDVLHLTMIFYPASFVIAILNQLFYKKPVYWSIRGDFDPHMMKRSVWKKKPVVFLLRRFLKSKVVFHSTCDAETQYAKELLGREIEVVQLTNYMEIPDQLNIPKKKYLLYLGRIDSKKAIENLISALDHSKKFRTSGFHLKIVGDYNNLYGQKLIKLVDQFHLEKEVEFVGHASGLEKQQLLAAAYFLIMPSHTENFGIVVAEALAQGTPAIASIHTPWKILEDWKAGFWLDNNVRSLAECIDQVLQFSTNDYAQLQENTRPLVDAEFNIYLNIDKWIAVYLEALGYLNLQPLSSFENVKN